MMSFLFNDEPAQDAATRTGRFAGSLVGAAIWVMLAWVAIR